MHYMVLKFCCSVLIIPFAVTWFLILNPDDSTSCNEILRLPSKMLIIFMSFLSAVMPPQEIAEIISLYNGRPLALK